MILCPHFLLLRENAAQPRWRLQISHDGAQRLWDVPRGPPLRPRERHLALERSLDAPALAFGPCWDAGPCEMRKWSANRVVLVLYGAKVKGCFSLVRFRGGARRRWSWVRVRISRRATRPATVTPRALSSPACRP